MAKSGHHSGLTPNFPKFLAKFFIFIQGINQAVRPFYPLCKGRYPGEEIARQRGPRQGIGWKLGGGPGLI